MQTAYMSSNQCKENVAIVDNFVVELFCVIGKNILYCNYYNWSSEYIFSSSASKFWVARGHYVI